MQEPGGKVDQMLLSRNEETDIRNLVQDFEQLEAGSDKMCDENQCSSTGRVEADGFLITIMMEISHISGKKKRVFPDRWLTLQ